ncbi:MAG: DUF1302 domain-containing protein [Deltaproteobacteria bacterium]|nr:DUF1302 domain-containing protein [Deltaproteobacteria bacterium]
MLQRKIGVFGLALVAMGLGFPAASWAQDDLLQGFDSPPTVSQPPKDADTEEDQGPKEDQTSWVELDGSLSIQGSYNYAHQAPPPGMPDWRGLSRLKLVGRADLKMTFSENWKAQLGGYGFYDWTYEIRGLGQYPDPLLALYRQELEPREAWVSGKMGPVDVKLGRQIVSWGKSNFLRVVDVFNPIDNREPGLVDVGDLKLPMTMSRVDVYWGDWQFTAVGVHEIKFNKNPVLGSDFYPAPFTLPEEIPLSNGENTEYGGAITATLGAWELGFYGANHFNDAGHAEPLTAPPGAFVLRHERLLTRGFSVSLTSGSWVMKLEGAQVQGLTFMPSPTQTLRLTRYDLLAGVEYYGWSDTTLMVETAAQQYPGWTAALNNTLEKPAELSGQTVVALTRDFSNKTVHAMAALFFFGPTLQNGGLQRYSLGYDLADALVVTGGVLMYQPGQPGDLLTRASDNDRVFFDVKWSF